MNEKRLHTASAFLTLTYNDDNLPALRSLVKRDLQLFMKRLRKISGNGLRFFACGEYGEHTLRPHYHVLLLNYDFSDRRPMRQSMEAQNSLYTSPELSSLWTAGNHVIGNVSFDSCAYVARYCMKKITGKPAAAHYGGREPEFIVMSRRPGIGTGYLLKHHSEIYAHDNIIVNGVPSSLPRFYDTKYALLNDTCEARLSLLKIQRRRKLNRAETTTKRLRIREVVTLAKLKLKGRIL